MAIILPHSDADRTTFQEAIRTYGLDFAAIKEKCFSHHTIGQLKAWYTDLLVFIIKCTPL